MSDRVDKFVALYRMGMKKSIEKNTGISADEYARIINVVRIRNFLVTRKPNRFIQLMNGPD